MRKALLSAYAGGNQVQSTVTERPYDRTRAGSYSPGLGIAATRLRACGDPGRGEFNDVILELHRMVMQRFVRSRAMPHIERANICRLAVAEWYFPKCKRCRGAGESKTEEGVVLASCPACNGVGVRNYKNSERAEALGHTLSALEHDVLTVALTYLVDHENQTTYNASASLQSAIPEGTWMATDSERAAYLAQLGQKVA